MHSSAGVLLHATAVCVWVDGAEPLVAIEVRRFINIYLFVVIKRLGFVKRGFKSLIMFDLRG